MSGEGSKKEPVRHLAHDPGVSLAQVLSIVAVLISAGTLGVALKRFDHERELEDRKDARKTLAEGALELGRVKAVQKDVFTLFEPLLAGEGAWPENFHDYIRNLERSSDALESALAAVRIRFPRNAAVVTELSAAWETGRSLMALYVRTQRSQLEDGRPRGFFSKDALRRRELAIERSEEGRTLSEKFDRHGEAYLDAAQAAVGAKLEHQKHAAGNWGGDLPSGAGQIEREHRPHA